MHSRQSAPDGEKHLSNRDDNQLGTLNELRDQIKTLTERVERLEASSSGVSPQGSVSPQDMTAPASREIRPEIRVDEVSEKESPQKASPWTLGGLATLMSRGAIVSLILLLALVLRTLTDSGALSLKPGTLLGMGYATALEATGLFMYRKRHSFAPIFSISGVLLLVAVVLEAHTGFGSISTIPAYIILSIAGGGMAAISWSQRATIPVAVGTLAILLAAVPLAFPRPEFVPLMVYLLAVNIMAFSAARLPRAWWLRIVAYLFTSGIFLLWSFDLRSSLTREGNAAAVSLSGFFIAVTLFFVYYIGVSIYSIWKSDPEIRRPFDNILPAAASAGAYVVSLIVVSATGHNAKVLGFSGVLAATFLLGVAALKARRAGTETKGTNTFAFPAAFLLALSFRDISGESVVALAILSWAAVSLGWLSTRWKSAGVRITAYFLQGTVLGASGLLLMLSPAGANTMATVASMVVIAVIALVHYHLVRKTVPIGDGLYFGRLDRKDVSGAIPLLVSVGAVFLAIRAVLFAVLGYGPAFTAGQSLVVNMGALALFLIARNRVNAEIKWIAVLVTILGGGKAFLYDLLTIKGLPVVVSVFSFGMAAAAGSWVLGQWHRLVDRKAVSPDE